MNRAEPRVMPLIARRWTLRGQVQGVGFRPFVYRLARRHELGGAVWNNSQGVIIEAQGDAESLKHFEISLKMELPVLARVDECRVEFINPRQDLRDFIIAPTPTRRSLADTAAFAGGTAGGAVVTVDTAVCPECLREMRDPENERFGHGLINCTQCGPRYSIVKEVPYDRSNTTMVKFAMCDRCYREYANPGNRRFHAQPIACPNCGPQVRLVTVRGNVIPGDAIKSAASALAAGKIVAIKGIGGFHLAVRCDQAGAVSRLRRLKHRDAKPFAVMCADEKAVEELVCLSVAGWRMLRDPAAPIVLASRRAEASVAAEVAPGNNRLGVMLAYTPLHHLLFDALRDIPNAPRSLIMTSGNVQDEPLVIDNAEAQTRLADLCDAILEHNRPIERCVDDSIYMDMARGFPLPIRRSRGFVPAPLDLPVVATEMGLCVGAELKNTVALVHGCEAMVSQHLGDITHPLAYDNFKQAIGDLEKLFGNRPRWIAHDLHPMYVSTGYARARAARTGVRLIGVQHHHAHAAALMGEHNQQSDILAVVCDGTGLAPDGSSWGGELLVAGLRDYRRLGGLAPLMLPGGDRAARDIRRCAFSAVYQAMGEDALKAPLVQALFPDARESAMLHTMMHRGVGLVKSSGTGRLFDALAALLGLAKENSFEAQAAMSVQAAADVAADRDAPALTTAWAVLKKEDGLEIDLRKFWRETLAAISSGMPAAQIAWCFHEALAQAWTALVIEGVLQTGIKTVGLTGGVMANARLANRLVELLEAKGLAVLQHRLVPTGDGGISYGQAVVAAALHAANATGGPTAVINIQGKNF